MLEALRSFLLRLLGGTALTPETREEPEIVAFSTDRVNAVRALANISTRINASRPLPVRASGAAMDAAGSGVVKFQPMSGPDAAVSEVQYAWYASQTFIGYQVCAIVAQHWLVDKVCAMPGRDAVRHGFKTKIDGLDADTPELAAIAKAYKRHRIPAQLQEYVHQGRVFGIRIAIFHVDSTDPKYYERPFNPDSVTPGSFKGVSQVDPYWCAPELDYRASADPASQQFYEPTWWLIGGKRYHRSHLAIFRTSQPADMLKPMYRYGGIPVTQQIMERVYAAERTANEAPQLAATKRMNVWKTDIAKAFANQERFDKMAANFVYGQNNYGVKTVDKDDAMEQLDTSLADFDSVLMSQYQLCAAIARVPATKLLGTTPKGFNATGEYEESSYHEELESLQANDLTPFLDGYLVRELRSNIEPEFGHAPGSLCAEVVWEPLDSPTAKEVAEINKIKAETGQVLISSGAIDPIEERKRISADDESDYHGVGDDPLGEKGDDPLDAAIAELEALAAPSGDPLDVAIADLEAVGAEQPDPLDAAIEALQPRDPLDEAIEALTGDALTLPRAAGVALTRPDGKTLFLRRSRQAEDEPDTWAFPGGMIEPGENPEEAARREVFEETGILLDCPLAPLGAGDGFITFAAVTLNDPPVTLNDEHSEYVWASQDKPPQPLHPAVKKLLRNG